MKPSPIECIHYCTGVPMGQIEYLFKTIELQGVVLELDLMQLAGIGIPIFKLFADHFSCGISEVKPICKDMVIRYPDFLTVIENLTSEGGVMYLDKKPRFAH